MLPMIKSSLTPPKNIINDNPKQRTTCNNKSWQWSIGTQWDEYNDYQLYLHHPGSERRSPAGEDGSQPDEREGQYTTDPDVQSISYQRYRSSEGKDGGYRGYDLSVDPTSEGKGLARRTHTCPVCHWFTLYLYFDEERLSLVNLLWNPQTVSRGFISFLPCTFPLLPNIPSLDIFPKSYNQLPSILL